MKVAVIGSRKVDKTYFEICELFKQHIPSGCSEIVSGGAVGIDTYAEKYAKENGIAFKSFLPDYFTHSSRAPLIRNDEIINYADYVLAIWDCSSHGTRYVIKKCLDIGKPIKVVRIFNSLNKLPKK